MLTRRQFRTKVMQSLYAYAHLEPQRLSKDAHQLLDTSVKNSYGLYLSVWKLWIVLYHRATEFSESSQKKYLKTGDEQAADKFLSNKFLQKIIQAEDVIEKQKKKQKIVNWTLGYEYVEILFKEILDSKWYQQYEDINTSFDDDRELMIKLYKKVIAPHDKFYECLEANEMTWSDDFPVVNTAVIRRWSRLQETDEDILGCDSFYKLEDKAFADTLLEACIKQYTDFDELIAAKSQNWEIERIARIDIILIKMCLIEIISFPEMPIKVSINEYVEISKGYTTPKSYIFINGILNALLEELTVKNIISARIDDSKTD